MIDLEIKLLFMNYERDKISYRNQIKSSTDRETIAELKNEIEQLKRLQLKLIEQYIAEVGSELPLEMQAFFTGEQYDKDYSNNELLVRWLLEYQSQSNNYSLNKGE